MTAQQIQNTGSGCLSRASSRNGNAKASRELAMNQTYMALTGLLMYRVAANEVCTRHMNAETVIITAVHHTRVRTATVSSSDVVAGAVLPRGVRREIIHGIHSTGSGLSRAIERGFILICPKGQSEMNVRPLMQTCELR